MKTWPYACELEINGQGWSHKDARKFCCCNKIITRGAPGSSSDRYMRDNPGKANVGSYESSDIVGISVNGKRPNRLLPDYEEIRLAAKAGVVFVTDDQFSRSRDYNIGEREVAEFLTKIGYLELSKTGIWNSLEALRAGEKSEHDAHHTT